MQNAKIFVSIYNWKVNSIRPLKNDMKNNKEINMILYCNVFCRIQTEHRNSFDKATNS